MLVVDVIVVPNSRNVSVTLDVIQLLDSSAAACVWIPDSAPTHHRDPYGIMAMGALATTRIRLGTGVTNPVSRHASVTAAGIATVEDVAPGRAVLGIGTGDAAVRAVGLKPAGIRDLEIYVGSVREWLQRWEMSVPVYIAGSGPRSLATAGRIADGVLINVGAHPILTGRARESVDRGAAEVGRDLGTLDVAFVVHTGIAEDEEEARYAARPLAARRSLDVAHHADYLPPELEHLREDALRVVEKYDYDRHLDPEASHSKAVSEELVDAFTVAGTPEQCLAKLRRIANAGATHVALLPSGTKRERSIELLAREVVPRL